MKKIVIKKILFLPASYSKGTMAITVCEWGDVICAMLYVQAIEVHKFLNNQN